MIEFGYGTWCPPLQGARIAADAERLGFDVCYFGDNTCFAPDPFSELRAAAEATTAIRLATGVTNTVTRHPSVVATSIAALQVASGGRAICGLGKGDSAMGVIGRGPQRHEEFVRNAEMLRTYLHRGSVQLGAWESRLEWLDDLDYSPVPIQVMCSGPRTMHAAAALADRITLAVGAAPERIAWALDVIDNGLAQAGRSRADVELGALIQVCVHDDRNVAAERLRTRVKGPAHMASFPGADLEAQPEILKRVTSRLRTAYDYKHHNNSPDNPLAELIDSEFADWFGIGGPESYVVSRLSQLVESGLSHFMIGGIPREEVEHFARVVMPEARKGHPSVTPAAAGGS